MEPGLATQRKYCSKAEEWESLGANMVVMLET